MGLPSYQRRPNLPTIDADSPASLKARLRRRQRALLRDRCPEDHAALTSALVGHLLRWLEGERPHSLLLYSPLPGEPDITPLLTRARTLSIQTVLPRVAGETLALHAVEGDAQLVPGCFDIPEPDPRTCPEIPVADIAVILLPGLGFDPATGIRLGRGAGYYDRLLTLPDCRATTVGVALPGHLLAGLPSQPHDRTVHLLATPQGIHSIPAPAAGQEAGGG